MVTIIGTSFGSKDASVELLGDSSVSARGSALAETIGPIALRNHNHTHISFIVPEGQGHNRRVRLTVGTSGVATSIVSGGCRLRDHFIS